MTTPMLQKSARYEYEVFIHLGYGDVPLGDCCPFKTVRGTFAMKLMKLKLQGSIQGPGRSPSNALEIP